jgi:putative oxidoreductase
MNTYSRHDIAKLILRLSLGILVLLHGIAKMRGGVAPIEQMLQGMNLPGFFAYGVFLGEVVGPALVIIGFYTRIGAGLIAVNMVFAVMLAHRGQIFELGGTGGYALELQMMYLLTAIAVALIGAGSISLKSRWN